MMIRTPAFSAVATCWKAGSTTDKYQSVPESNSTTHSTINLHRSGTSNSAPAPKGLTGGTAAPSPSMAPALAPGPGHGPAGSRPQSVHVAYQKPVL